MREMLITMYAMLALSMGALFGLAIYLGYRAGYAKARQTQRDVVAAAMLEFEEMYNYGAGMWPIQGTELGRRFLNHIEREKETHAIPESEAEGKSGSKEGPGRGEAGRPQRNNRARPGKLKTLPN